MIDFEKLLHDTVDQNQNATWGGSIYALKDLLMFINNNKDLDTKSKVIIKRQIEDEIKHYEDLKNRTQTGKKLNEISKQTGFDLT